jgi:hypothetical protein
MPLMISIALTGATRKVLMARLQQASTDQASRTIRRIHALLELAAGRTIAEVAVLLGVGEQHPKGTRRDGVHAFVRRGTASLA